MHEMSYIMFRFLRELVTIWNHGLLLTMRILVGLLKGGFSLEHDTAHFLSVLVVCVGQDTLSLRLACMHFDVFFRC